MDASPTRMIGTTSVSTLMIAAALQMLPRVAAQDEAAVTAFSRHMTGTYVVIGDEQKRISYVHGDYIAPRLLPGCERVILNSRRDGAAGIYIEEIDGDGVGKVCAGDQVSVSPDGGSIALRRDGAIVVRVLESGEEMTVSPAEWKACAHPSIVADGRVLFVRDGNGVYVAGPEGPERLITGEIASAPRCSPDGTAVAYQNGAHVYLYDMESGESRRLTTAGGVQSWPLWSRDGRSVAYLQSPSPLDGPRHLHRVSVDDPGAAMLLVRDIQGGPDWNGMGLDEGARMDVPGQAVSVSRADSPADGALTDADWQEMAIGDGSVTGNVLVDCAWGAGAVSATTGRVYLGKRTPDGLAQTVEIVLLGAESRVAVRTNSATLTALDADSAVLDVSVAMDDDSVGTATLLISRTNPLVRVRPGEGILAIRVLRETDLAIVPDRLAHDLLYGPADHASLSIPLPRTPMVLCRPTDGDGMLMVASPHEGQTIRLVRGEGIGAFTGVRVETAEQEVGVAFLPGDDLWLTPSIEPAEANADWSVEWSNAFPAQWRLVAQGTEARASMMVRMDTPIRGKPRPLEGSKGMSGLPASAVVYAYGRSQNTPLDRAMPVDVLWEMVGLDAATELLDAKAARAYREADGPAAYVDPRVALKAVGWIRGRTRDGARGRIARACRDIETALEGLDARAREYESAFGRMQNACEAAGVYKVEALLDAGLAEAERQMSGRAIPNLNEVGGKMNAFRLDTDAAYSPFASAVTGALTPRLVRLGAYRSLAKAARHEAGRALSESPEKSETCEQVRQIAGEVLGNRSYLEGDWAGEEPLGGPEVSYDEIKDW